MPSEIGVKSSENRRKKQRGNLNCPALSLMHKKLSTLQEIKALKRNRIKHQATTKNIQARNLREQLVLEMLQLLEILQQLNLQFFPALVTESRCTVIKNQKRLNRIRKCPNRSLALMKQLILRETKRWRSSQKKHQADTLTIQVRNIKKQLFRNKLLKAQPIVPSKHNDRNPKRRQKKSEKIEHPSVQLTESACPLGEEVIKENPKEFTEDNQNEASGSHLRHPGEKAQGAAVFGEASVIAHPARVDPAVPLSHSDK